MNATFLSHTVPRSSAYAGIDVKAPVAPGRVEVRVGLMGHSEHDDIVLRLDGETARRLAVALMNASKVPGVWWSPESEEPGVLPPMVNSLTGERFDQEYPSPPDVGWDAH